MDGQQGKWALETAEKIWKKVQVTAARSGESIPYTTADGRFDDHTKDINWWTNGFFAGQLWQLHHAFGDEKLARRAMGIEEKLDRGLMDYQGMDHDSGFKWLLTSAAHYRMTQDPAARNRVLLAAANLAGRFNLKGRFIRAWNGFGNEDHIGWAIIDCLMNLPLLYWATEETGDPRFSQIAMAHADTAITAFLRPGGSVHHIVRFDPVTGEKLNALGGQGMAEGSSWTRGQAWGLYGFTLSFLHTGRQAYLDAARKIAQYIIRHIPESHLMPVDFCQDPACPFEDGTAAAITACGLLELKKQAEDSEAAQYHQAALQLLKALVEKRCDFSLNNDAIVTHCSAAYHDDRHNFPIIYGDYFLTEALLKLCGKELFMW